jgi:carbon monoxide dehydrogenase subunit G
MNLQCNEHINAPIERVFAASTDVPRWAETISAITKIEMLTDGPVGVGTRFRETRKMFGKEATEEMTFTAFDPPNSYTLHAQSHGCLYESGFRFTPEGQGARVEFFFRGEPQTFGAKVMNAIMGPLFKGSMVKMVRKDMLDLKAHVESGAA